MERLLLVALAGFAASLVDGTLGMGFGPTSATILLAAGVAPAAASFTINLAKVASGAAGGAAHYKFGNLRHDIVLRLAIAGSLGAIIGVALLSRIEPDDLKPILSGLLCLVGLRIIYRFVRTRPARSAGGESRDGRSASGPRDATRPRDLRIMSIAGFFGGISNGLIGAWGPVVTPVVMQGEDVDPRVAIGSVNIAEIGVATVTSIMLIATRGFAEVEPGLLIALLVGGVIAAPVAAWAVKVIPAEGLGVAVGALLLFTNTEPLAGALNGVSVGEAVFNGDWVRWMSRVVVLVALSIAFARFVQARRRRNTSELPATVSAAAGTGAGISGGVVSGLTVDETRSMAIRDGGKR